MIREKRGAAGLAGTMKRARTWAAIGILAASAAAFLGEARAASEALPRFPTLHGDTIVFEAAGNLWRVSRQGGVAQRLTTDNGMDLMPRFSPDGQWIAFTGQYDGNTDVYVIPAEGGAARRLTFHSDVVPDAPMRWGPDNMVVTWTPDGKKVVFLSRRDTFNSWFGRLFLVPVTGGLAEPMPLPSGGTTSFSPDGKKIAYTPIFRDFRTWKQYYGGLAQDIWIYDLATHASERLTDWKGTDRNPMWRGDTIYFASDRGPEKRVNIWACDLRTKSFRQVTKFTDYDIDWPSLGDAGIVFQCGGSLYVLDLPSEQLHEVRVTTPVDGLRTRPRWVDASKNIQNFGVSPNGKRALFEARGEIFTVPAEHGDARDLTRTSGAREMYPAWSPDGKWIVYVTDVTGEPQIAIRPAEGFGEETLLTRREKGYLYGPVWSPDGEKLAVSDADHVLWLLTVKDRQAKKVDSDPRREIRQYAWSPDARWLAYSKAATNDMGQVYLYSLESGKATQVSTGMTDDGEPVFSPDGRLLYFLSARHENPVFSESEFNVATLKMYGVYVATLRKGDPSPFAPRSDEGAPKEGEPAAEKKAEAAKPGAIPPIQIDLDGLAARVVPLPVPAGDISRLAAAAGRVYYLTAPIQSFENALPGEEPGLHVFDMDKRKDAVLVKPADAYALSADGMKVIYRHEKAYTITDALPGGGAGKGEEDKPRPLDLGGLQALIDPVAEWNEMFHEAWRLERDLFFITALNGVDWAHVLKQYEKLLPLCACREDLNYLIGEMLGELHNSHTYVGGGEDAPGYKRTPTGLLGVDYGLDAASGRYYFARIFPGDNSREDFRSPLTEPGVNVKEKSFLLAVDGRDLKAPADPDSLFVNTLKRTVTLTVADDAKGANRRDVVVKPVTDELNLRLKAWVDHNREVVDKATEGRVGYVYLSDMESVGMEEFIRQFYPQIRKQGLIVDVRWNGGGEIDQILLERLRRILVGMETNRQATPFPIPAQLIPGPKACLINHYSASDGDIFPYYFRKYGLGPLIGTRTWGGVRGIRGFWPLADGGYVTIPEFSLYGLDSQWNIENHGVDPDVEIENLPGDVIAGKDAQLEAAIRYVVDELAKRPATLPPPPSPLPAYPPEGR